jgi:hypothetical protein
VALFSREEGKEFYETTGVLRKSGQPAKPRRRSFDQLDVPKGDVLDLRPEGEIEEKPASHFVEKPKRGGQIFFSQAMALPIAISGDALQAPVGELRQVRGITDEQRQARQVAKEVVSAQRRATTIEILSTASVAIAIIVLLTLAVFAYFNVSVPSLPAMRVPGF